MFSYSNATWSPCHYSGTDTCNSVTDPRIQTSFLRLDMQARVSVGVCGEEVICSSKPVNMQKLMFCIFLDPFDYVSNAVVNELLTT